MDNLHPYSTASGRRFDKDRIADLFCNFHGFFRVLNCVLCSGNYRDSGFHHEVPCSDFASHFGNYIAWRAYENNAFFLAALCKSRVFGKKTVAGVDCLSSGVFCNLNDSFHIQVALA